MKRWIILISMILIGNVFSADERQKAEYLIEEVDGAIKTIPLGFEWRYTAEYIDEAKQLLEAGDLEKSYQKALKAQSEINLALEQAKKAKTVSEIAVPK